MRHLVSFLCSLLLFMSALPAHAFVNNGNGTVTDTVTGLTWMRCAVGQSWTGSTCTGDAGAFSWSQAIALKSTFAGYTDWRLAGIEELRSLVDMSQSGFKINPVAFPNIPSFTGAGYPAGSHSGFWSTSASLVDSSKAWGVNFGDGMSSTVSKELTFGFARLVRTGSSAGPYALLIGKFGTGSGVVFSSPAGLNCGETCAKTLASGTSVTLGVVPAPGSYFAGWGGACVGRTPCTVTMDAGRSVKAFFNLIPFDAGVTSNITATNATVRTNINFNAADKGKQGSVFITATVRARALLTTLRKTALPGPDRAAADEAPTTTDPASTVLIQLTESGWQQVVDGQLVPYASGVLGEALAAQTILNNTSTTDLQGAEFCMGYGTNSSEMVAGGRMVSVASIPDPAATTEASTGTCAVSGEVSTAATPLSGLWWNPAESGWGISLTQQGAIVFAAWYTYDQSGQPIWYVMTNCPLAANSCTGEIYRVVGATSLTVPWNGAGKVLTKVGSGTLFFTDNDNANFSYSVDGSAASRTIMRQVFAAGSAEPAVDYTALWWNAAESGWGVSLTQQYAMIFAAMFTYDSTGNPIWYVVTNCPVVATACEGELYKVIGGTPPSVPWNGANKVLSKVGSARFSFADSSNGTMTYTINGVNGSRAITRQLF